MKHIMWGMGLNPLVIPNGIPSSLLNNINEKAAARLRKSIDADLVLSKVARWDPDKRWNMAIEATARLKASGRKTALLARGGIEPHGEEVMQNARFLGLVVKDARAKGDTVEDYFEAISRAGTADIMNLRFHLPQEFLRIIYHSADAVLANSGHEPFGLVGLEAMAAGGIAFVGGTGEDYAIPFHNCIVLETSDPKEIEVYMMYLEQCPEEKDRIRRAARRTARQFTWEGAVENLIQKLEYRARIQGLLAAPKKASPLDLKPFEFQGSSPEWVAVPVESK